MTELYEKYGNAAERMLHFVENRTTDQAPDVMRVPVEDYLSEERWQQEMDRIFMRLPLMLALTTFHGFFSFARRCSSSATQPLPRAMPYSALSESPTTRMLRVCAAFFDAAACDRGESPATMLTVRRAIK